MKSNDLPSLLSLIDLDNVLTSLSLLNPLTFLQKGDRLLMVEERTFTAEITDFCEQRQHNRLTTYTK